jgi:predicted nucleic acid-binding protein
MSYLLDTNILSETLKKKPSSAVIKWLKTVPSEELFISVLTFGEIRKGIEKLDKGKHKNQLILWLEHELPKWFADRILPITKEVADRWGYLTGKTSRTLPAIDGLLAATALVYNLKMVTRNTKDFVSTGVELIDPFSSS